MRYLKREKYARCISLYEASYRLLANQHPFLTGDWRETWKRLTAFALALLGSAGMATVASHAQEPVEITFFIWAGSTPGHCSYGSDRGLPRGTPRGYDQHTGVQPTRSPILKWSPPSAPPRTILWSIAASSNVDSMTKGDVDDMWSNIEVADVPEPRERAARISVVRKTRGVGFQMSGIGILYNKDQVSGAANFLERAVG